MRWRIVLLLALAACSEREREVTFDYPAGFEGGTQILAVKRGVGTFDEFYALPVGEPLKVGDPTPEGEVVEIEARMYTAPSASLPFDTGPFTSVPTGFDPPPGAAFALEYADGTVSDWAPREVPLAEPKLPKPCPEPELELIGDAFPADVTVRFARSLDGTSVIVGTAPGVLRWTESGTVTVTSTSGSITGGAVAANGDIWLGTTDGVIGRIVQREPLELDRRFEMGVDEPVGTIRVSDDGETIFALGNKGRLARFGNGVWEDFGTPYDDELVSRRSILLTPDGVAFITDDSPRIGVYRDGSLEEEYPDSSRATSFSGLMLYDGRLLAFGRLDRNAKTFVFERSDDGSWTTLLEFESFDRRLTHAIAEPPFVLYTGSLGMFGVLRPLQWPYECPFDALEQNAVGLLRMNDGRYFSIGSTIRSARSVRLIRFDPALSAY